MKLENASIAGSLIVLLLLAGCGSPPGERVGAPGDGVRVSAPTPEEREGLAEKEELWGCRVSPDKCTHEARICKSPQEGAMSCSGGKCKGQCKHGCSKNCWASIPCKCSVGLCYCPTK